MLKIEPYKIDVSSEAVARLHERIDLTRWPEQVEGAGWEYGTNLGYLEDLVAYWRHEFDWFAAQEALNRFSHFRVNVDGLWIQFVHESGRGDNPLPIVLTHGWPSSIVELTKLIPLLTDPAAHGADAADNFAVIVPSLPGFGFSDRPLSRGSYKTAERWHELMTEGLGFRRFGAHGGDIGAGVTSRLGLYYPQSLLGIHLTAIMDAYQGPDAAPPTPEEQAYLDGLVGWERAEGAYGDIQGTKPQTLAYGLNDSPAGLAAWIVEKWRSWSDSGGDVESRFSKNELLTNISIYWFTETINSSVRHYYESRHNQIPLKSSDYVAIPTGVAQFPNEFAPESHPPRSWGERTYNIKRWQRFDRGGHFAAFEEPEIVARELREFFRPLREKSYR